MAGAESDAEGGGAVEPWRWAGRQEAGLRSRPVAAGLYRKEAFSVWRDIRTDGS